MGLPRQRPPPAYLSGGAARADGPQGISAVIAESRRRKARVELAERYADWIVALPASAHFHSRPFVNFLRLGIPFAAAEDEPEGERAAHPFAGSGVRILHAPSDPVFKGSPVIRRCIDSLRAEGHAIDYAEVTGRPHREVVEAIRACDLVVDSVYSDTPMAVLATEAAFFGKPTVITGYFAACIREELAADLIPPTAFDVPDELIATVRRLVVDERERRRLGDLARRFVREQWAPERVAERLMRLIDDDVPPDWVVTPSDLRYVHGWGLSEDDARKAVKAVLEAGGPSSLLLDHEPPMRERVIRFAEGA